MAHLDFKLMQVLVLEVPRIYGGYVSIPNKIGNMSCLRYLRLKGGFSGHLPNSIVKLKHLETIDIRKNDIRLPSGVWESKQLRHLFYEASSQASNGCFFKSPNMYSLPSTLTPNNLQILMWIEDEFVEPRLLDGLSKLRKLGIRGVSNSTIKILSALSPVPPALEVLKLEFYRERSEQINLSSYTNIVKLCLVDHIRTRNNSEALPPNLVKLTLVDVWVDHHLLTMLKKLPKLRILKMVCCFHNEEKMDLCCEANGDSFPQFEVLHIKKPFDLSQVTCRDDIGMPKLNKVILVKVSYGLLMKLPKRIAKLRI